MHDPGWMTALKNIANKDHSRIEADRTIGDAVGQMVSTGTSVVVFLEGELPVGILTERDVVSFLHAGIGLDTPLSAVKRTPLTISGDKTLLFGLNMLIDNNIRRIVVVDLQGRFAGVVTQEDLLRSLEGELYRRDARIMDVLTARQTLRSVPAGDSLAAVVRVMTSYNVGSVLVTEQEKVIGIITERDLVKIAGRRTPLTETAGAVMSAPVITAPIDSSVMDVLKMMKRKNIRRIVITYHDGTPFRIITNRDILRNLENSHLEFLSRKIRHAREVLDLLPEIIVEVIDVAGEQVIQWCNRKTRHEFGRDMANLPISSLVPPETWAVVYPEIIRQGRVEKARVEIGERIFELSASHLKMQREGIIQAILIDITSEENLSTRDYLTGVYNRRKFDEILEAEIERVKRYGHHLSMSILDIDRFKVVNDSYGHQAGDRVLKELANLVAMNIREVDYLARYGGEEFVVLASYTDIAGMRRLSEKLRTLIGSHLFEEERKLTVSLGVAQYATGETKERFFERADAALYRAKEGGRNRVESTA